MQRREDWEVRLIDWLHKAIDTPFQWGQFDCALAAADALQAQTGHDFAKGWRGQYTTAGGALKQLLKRQCHDVYEVVARELQTIRVEPQQLQRGDIAGADLANGKTLGIVWGETVWLPETQGLRAHSLSLVECGWRLPCRQ
ncbi:DUF6950 family protein [Endozoicomonas numazuensis]|uniref:DUF6950 family protein n=1 Tax=Endozoicomonas numazuensis TaxID=1137799 RepID=UPI00068AE939|nr:hypothetical protein [Endozoicomonas numazuensis]